MSIGDNPYTAKRVKRGPLNEKPHNPIIKEEENMNNKYKVGEVVQHEVFGEGVVHNVVNDIYYSVKFGKSLRRVVEDALQSKVITKTTPISSETKRSSEDDVGATVLAGVTVAAIINDGTSENSFDGEGNVVDDAGEDGFGGDDLV